MMRRILAAVFLSLLLLVGVATRADASASRACWSVWYGLSDTPLRVCLPMIVER